MLGGTEIATLGMVRALVEGGWDVGVVCYHEWDAAMVARYEKAGALVERLEHPRGDFRGLFRRLVRLFRERRPAVAHIQYMAPGLLPILAAKWAGVPRIFATVHAAGSAGFGLKAKAMLRFAGMFTDHFFCVSENCEKFWFGKASGAKTGAERRRVRHSTIYNGVDVEAIQAAGRGLDRAKERAALGISANAPVVGIVGRVVKLKGHDVLFRAAGLLKDTLPQLRILVVGEGPDREYFEQVAREAGIAERIVWAGRVEPEELPKYYHLMDVLAMPSRWEGFGLTAVEAMAAGVPVVGSDVPGLREVLSEGLSGFLSPVGDSSGFAEQLEKAFADGRRSVRQRMPVFALDSYALDSVRSQWLNAYARFPAGRTDDARRQTNTARTTLTRPLPTNDH